METENLQRKYLLIDKCIAIANGVRASKNKETIKDKKHLARLICGEEKENIDNKYMILYRAEKDGFLITNDKIVKEICDVLKVEQKQLFGL